MLRKLFRIWKVCSWTHVSQTPKFLLLVVLRINNRIKPSCILYSRQIEAFCQSIVIKTTSYKITISYLSPSCRICLLAWPQGLKLVFERAIKWRRRITDLISVRQNTCAHYLLWIKITTDVIAISHFNATKHFHENKLAC